MQGRKDRRSGEHEAEATPDVPSDGDQLSDADKEAGEDGAGRLTRGRIAAATKPVELGRGRRAATHRNYKEMAGARRQRRCRNASIQIFIAAWVAATANLPMLAQRLLAFAMP